MGDIDCILNRDIEPEPKSLLDTQREIGVVHFSYVIVGEPREGVHSLTEQQFQGFYASKQASTRTRLVRLPAWLAKNPPVGGAVFSHVMPGVEPNLRRQSPPGWARHQYWRDPPSFFYPPQAAEQSKVW